MSRRAEAFHNRGIAFRAKGDLDKAVSDITQGIRLDPQHAYRFQERGEIYLDKDDYGQAIADLNQAIRLDATRAFRFHWRGLAYAGIGNYPLAIADFTEAIRLDPIKRGFRFYDRANALREAGQYERATLDYEEVLQLDPTNGWAFVDRGRTYKRMKQFASARNDFDAALRVPNASPELRQAVAEEMAELKPLPPPPPPDGDVRRQRLSDLNKIRSIIEEKLPAIHFADLRTQADQVLAKLAAANLHMSADDLDNLIRDGEEIVKRLNEMHEFDRISAIATRQK